MFHKVAPQRGITLFEAVSVLAILAIMSLIAIPPIHRARESYRLVGIAHQVRTELHRTRILAIARNRDCRLRVTSAHSYRVECQMPAWTLIELHTIPVGYTIQANNHPEFHPLGNVGPMATIVVTNSTGTGKRVIVNRSGRIRIQ